MADEPEALAGPSMTGPGTAANNTLALRSQHVVPHFLLKNFSHRYVVSNNPNEVKGRRRDPKTGILSGEVVVKSLRLSDEFPLEAWPARRPWDLENMYDSTENLLKDYDILEEKFAILENAVGLLYRKVFRAYKDGEVNVWFTRPERDALRKFLFLLALRSVQYHGKYNIDSLWEYQGGDKGFLSDYMKEHDFDKPIDVWLQSLERIIDLEIDPDGDWKTTIRRIIYVPIADMFIDHMEQMELTICTPGNHVEEFVLTDNYCNVTEGLTPNFKYDSFLITNHLDLAPCFHKFAPISPKLMIVLRSKYLPESLDNATRVMTICREAHQKMLNENRSGNGIQSMLQDLPVRKPSISYMAEIDGEVKPRIGHYYRQGKHDNFCFTINKIPSHNVRIINGLLIDQAFYGSRIIFVRKRAFLDLVEWFLAEPCQVGKKLTETHSPQQLIHIKGLSQFVRREGRDVTTKWTFKTNKDRDHVLSHVQNVAAAKFLEEPNFGKNGNGLDCDALYRRLGGTDATYTTDMTAAIIMFETWTMSVDLDFGSADYISSCREKLERLLEGHQGQPTTRFWLFLKKIRLAQTASTRALQLVKDTGSFIMEDYQGPEDVLVYAHSIIPDREINVAMYKAFNESIAVLRGKQHGLESIGFFSLFHDTRWRIPNPSAGVDKPYEVCLVKGQKGTKGKEAVRPPVPDTANGQASTTPLCQAHKLVVKENEERKAVCCSNSRASTMEPLTAVIEQIKPSDIAQMVACCSHSGPSKTQPSKVIVEQMKPSDIAQMVACCSHSGPSKTQPSKVIVEQMKPSDIAQMVACCSHSGPSKTQPSKVIVEQMKPSDIAQMVACCSHSGPSKTQPSKVIVEQMKPSDIAQMVASSSHSGPSKIQPLKGVVEPTKTCKDAQKASSSSKSGASKMKPLKGIVEPTKPRKDTQKATSSSKSGASKKPLEGIVEPAKPRKDAQKATSSSKSGVSKTKPLEGIVEPAKACKDAQKMTSASEVGASNMKAPQVIVEQTKSCDEAQNVASSSKSGVGKTKASNVIVEPTKPNNDAQKAASSECDKTEVSNVIVEPTKPCDDAQKMTSSEVSKTKASNVIVEPTKPSNDVQKAASSKVGKAKVSNVIVEQTKPCDDAHEAASSLTPEASKTKAPKVIVEQTKPCDDDKPKAEAGIKKEICTEVDKAKKTDSSASCEKGEKGPADPKGKQPMQHFDVQMEAGPVVPQPGHLSQLFAWHRRTPAGAIILNKEAYDKLVRDGNMPYASIANAFLLTGSVVLYAVGALAYILSKVSHGFGIALLNLVGGLVWLLNGLEVVLSSLPFPCFTVAKYLLLASITLVVVCSGILKTRRILQGGN